MIDATLINAPLHCNVADAHRGHVAVIGNMDGVHLGHQALVKETLTQAASVNAPAAAIVFEPHPRKVFRPDTPPFQLTDLETKRQILGRLGVKTIFVLPFIEGLHNQTPAEFVSVTLAQRLGVKGIVTGSDFQFGAGRAGNADALSRLAQHVGLFAHAVTPVLLSEDEKYSSSGVRAALRDGKIETAAKMLGRPWVIRGPVIEGRRLARTLDFPTANIPLGDYVRPKFGVYAVNATTTDGSYHGVANIGVRPTVDGTQEMLEAHLFDFAGDLYGQTVNIAVRHFIRPEQKFDGLPALKAQIADDAKTAAQWLEENPHDEAWPR